jgi:hypothetical protein
VENVRSTKSNQAFSLLLYVLGFLLFWEWLRPLAVIAKETDLSYFISFAAFSFLLAYLRLPIWVTFPAKLLAMIYAIHLLFFYNSSIVDPLWVSYFMSDFHDNVIFMFNGNWAGMSDLFRSFLFFLLLWIVSYLMHYWLIQTRKLFLFFFVTVIYLTVLDSFTMYHANAAIVRTMVIGLILLGLLRLINIQESEKVTFEKGRWPLPWLLGLILMIIFTTSVGYAAPKFKSKWPDPVPYIQKAENGYQDSIHGIGNGNQRIGYGTDDTHLGGAFSMDQTPVFTASEKYAHYWKIETKNTYTGEGWVNEPDNRKITLNHFTDLVAYPSLESLEGETPTEVVQDHVHMELSSFPQLVYGVEPLGVKAQGMNQILLNQVSGKMVPELNGKQITVKDYTVTYKDPTFSVPSLQTITKDALDPETIKQTYLQLPKELPERVKKLAATITKKADNRYDEAEAIVTYFQTNGYKYETQNVGVPNGNQDYVDQFLFDTKEGYCDNFSSSMVVLLRSVGVPARWVKGFSQGTYLDSPTQTTTKYVIKQSDAHSWVEVYFPGSGWVPFEPTLGYDSNSHFSYGTGQAAKVSTTPTPKETTPNKAKVTKQITPPNENKGVGLGMTSGVHMSSKILYWILWILLTLGALTAIYMIKIRKLWLPFWWKFRLSKRTDDLALDVAFHRLLKLLALNGYKKKENQTLREFAREVDKSLGTYEMGKIVTQIEKRHYHKPTPDQWMESKEFWEKMINKLRA